MSASRVAAAIALLMLAHPTPTCRAYTGGPIRAEVAGFDPTEHKIYYLLRDLDESGTPPQVYHFSLDAPDPEKAIRDPGLEPAKITERSEAWEAVWRRLVPLRGLRNYEMKLDVSADSVGIDTLRPVPEYQLHVTVETASRERTLELNAFCDPLCRVRGVYVVPGRHDRMVVLSYIGRSYGCEEIDVPVLLPPRAGWPKVKLGAAADSNEAGALAGMVTDTRGRPLLSANVYVDGVWLGAYTVSDGTYALTGVPSGRHVVRVRLMGYAPDSASGVRVDERSTTVLDFTLKEKPVHMSDCPVIVPARPAGRRNEGSR